MKPYTDPAKLYFLFDLLSHNAWLAWGESQKLARRFDLEFEPVPVVFGAMLKAHGQLGPAEIAPKSRWMIVDVLRKARALNLPIAPPHSHPFNPLIALRLCCCALEPEARLRLIDVLWRAAWAESREMANAEVLRERLDAAGFDGAALLAEAHADGARQRLRDNTGAALAAGAFGVPSVFARGQMFWGYDDLPNLEAFLDHRDPLAAQAGILEPWLALRPSVQRPR